MWHLLEPSHGVCQQWVGLLTPVLALLQTLSRLHCCADRAAPARDIDDGCLHTSAHSAGVSLDEASACWTFIPFELPIHPTAMVHGVSSLMPTSVLIWCSLIGAERPNWGGSSQKLGRIDRVWGRRGADRPGADRLWGGSSVSHLSNLGEMLRGTEGLPEAVIIKKATACMVGRQRVATDRPVVREC